MIQSSSSKIAEDEVEGTDDVPGTRDTTLSQREYCFIIEEDPRTLSEAMASRDVAFWKEAVQNFRQKEGIDFFDTYAPVARISTIRLLLALIAIHDLVIHQMDVKTAFLNGDLDEEIYMKQPEGFVMPGHESKVCKLKKSLYGLKQAPKQWHQKFDDVVTDQDQVNKTKEFLSSSFDMKDLGEAEVILGIRIKRGNNDPTVKPDIAFAVGKLSRYTSNPSALHWQALSRVFQYLKGTMDYGLNYSGYPFVIEGYSAASWINNMEDHSSTSAGNEAEWLRNLIYEIPLWPKPISTISIRCDSAATLAKAYSQVYNGKSRHLGVRHSMIRELIMNGVISVEFVKTQLNLADHLTKGLARDLVRKAAIGMGLKST
ncbi:zinc finger, CCHC-type containing protein [Tanacetum coccineum]